MNDRLSIHDGSIERFDLLDPVAYWLPPQFVVSAWLEHAPFAYWIMRAARPRTVVELGTHNGFSFFVFAEAAKRLGLSTALTALDSWEGDDQAGFYGNEVFEGVDRVVKEDYPNAKLIKGYFSDSVGQFDDGSIDLLHIDGRHGYEDVAEDFELYRPKLSERAIVLFHDTSEFREGFGVHRFWGEISKGRPSFNFEHGHGLGVLAWGSSPPIAVSAFLDFAMSNQSTVRRQFSERGTEVSRQFVLEVDHFDILHRLRVETQEQEQTIHQLRGALEGLEERNQLMRAEIADREGEIARVLASVSWRATAPLRALRRKLGG